MKMKVYRSLSVNSSLRILSNELPLDLNADADARF